jgi:TetR/AcrR family transcriptional regulator, cholesterol catabolism regulator
VNSRPSERPPRADNRLPQVLDAAAAQFAEKGYQATSIRDIVRAVGMLPGSLYYHFANKDELLVAVYQEGVRRIVDAVEAAIAGRSDPWERLEAACVAHLECLLNRSAYAKVVTSVHPADVPAVAATLVRLRDGYERRFVALIAALPLPPRTSRPMLRMMLLGALNWTPIWYRHDRASARRIARSFVQLLRNPLAP